MRGFLFIPPPACLNQPQWPAHRAQPTVVWAGWTLTECLCTLGVLALLSLWAVPSLQRWVVRAQVHNAVHSWLNDYQAARVWALRQGQAVVLQRANACGPTVPSTSDWRCGWDLHADNASANTLWRRTQLDGGVAIEFSPAQSQLRIDARGSPSIGGLSLRFRPDAPAWRELAATVCINLTGRWRIQSGEGCDA